MGACAELLLFGCVQMVTRKRVARLMFGAAALSPPRCIAASPLCCIALLALGSGAPNPLRPDAPNPLRPGAPNPHNSVL